MEVKEDENEVRTQFAGLYPLTLHYQDFFFDPLILKCHLPSTQHITLLDPFSSVNVCTWVPNNKRGDVKIDINVGTSLHTYRSESNTLNMKVKVHCICLSSRFSQRKWIIFADWFSTMPSTSRHMWVGPELLRISFFICWKLQ